MTFNQLKIGEKFRLEDVTGKMVLATKIDSRQYRIEEGPFAGRERRTSGNKIVNEPSKYKDRLHEEKQLRQKLDSIAKKAGYKNWRTLSLAAVRGKTIIIN